MTEHNPMAKPTNDGRLKSPSAARNRDPILEVLRTLFEAEARVLEIGSGSGEHAVFFAEALPRVTWIPSDPDAEAIRSVVTWTSATGATNVELPLQLDVRDPTWPVEELRPIDAIVSINMIHIAPWSATLGLLRGAARVLEDGGLLFLYGPFRRGGTHTAPSNARFDQWLKERDPSYGVRDLDDISREAEAVGLGIEREVEMPANNLSLILRQRNADRERC